MAEKDSPLKNHPVESGPKSMSLSPSDIYFIPCAGSKDDVNHNTTTTPCASVEPPTEDSPSLKVVEKGGVYFTLDNCRLSELKRLFSLGQCQSVTAEVVPLENVPQGIQDMLVLPVPIRQKGRLHGRGPLKLLNFLHLDRKSPVTCSTDEDTDDDTDRSDSECDWVADVK